ncbi:MAG: peptidylprolyl isomerase [Sandaracinaceae bacterium]
MIDAIEAQADGGSADEAALRAFYEAEAWRFRGSPRFVVEHAWFSDDGADGEARAEAAARSTMMLAGDEGALPLPAGPLSMRTLTQRLGPTAARGVAELEVGETGGPWRARGGWHVARLVAREPGEVPPFETVIAQVREEQRRVLEEAALRAFLDERRREAEIVVAGDAS